MTKQTAGIHHITAFARNPQENYDFYTGILGLHLVKKTVNFDATHVYHLYFGDAAGSPGTILTFFPTPNARKGQVGGGQVGTITFVIPHGSIDYWEERLSLYGVQTLRSRRFNETFVEFTDQEGLQLELVEREIEGSQVKSIGGIPADKAILGLGGAVLYSTNFEKTIDVLEYTMGLSKVGEDQGYARFQSISEIGNIIDIPLRSMEWGHSGAGTVHHIAWRATDDVDHEAWRTFVADNGYHVTPVKDRQYFKAIYFRENGGILFEIATDPPGFARDEAPDALGKKLMLPAWYEERRAEIEAKLLPIVPIEEV